MMKMGPDMARTHRLAPLQILPATDAAIRLLVYLALIGSGKRVSGMEIRQAQKISPSLLAKAVRPLVRKGFVHAARGVSGGFVLVKPPESINLLEIVEAVQGPLLLNKCLSGPGVCEHDLYCPVHPVWQEIRERAERILCSWSLSDLARSARVRRSLSGQGS